MMRIVSVRHGRKQPGVHGLEYDIPLDPAECLSIARLASGLADRGMVPSIWLASHFAHCWQTAVVLARAEARTIRLCALTPYSASEGGSLKGMLAELDRLRISLPQDAGVIGIVGHEERLSNIIRTLIVEPKAMRMLDRLEAAVIEGGALADFAHAKGRFVEFLAPTTS